MPMSNILPLDVALPDFTFLIRIIVPVIFIHVSIFYYCARVTSLTESACKLSSPSVFVTSAKKLISHSATVFDKKK